MWLLLTDYWVLLVLVPAVVVGAVTDVVRGKIYNKVTYATAVVALVGQSLFGGLWGDGGLNVGLLSALGGLAVGGGVLLLAVMAGGLHGGDVKLMAAVGALLGWQVTLLALMYTLVAAAAVSVVLILVRGVFWRTMRRLAAFFVLVLTTRKPMDPATADSPQVPFGLAIAIGSLAAAVEVLLRGGWSLSIYGT
ncbi:MAG: prepilin peptidase [Phycisphaerae bacterium]|nr:prepilin peptidase [Phycisphaerae bacterium]